MNAAWPRELRALTLTAAAAAVLYVWLMLERAIGGTSTAVPWSALVHTRALVHLSMAATFAVAVVRADAAVDAGAAAYTAYARATVGAAFVGALLQFAIHRLLGWPDGLKGGAAIPIAPLQIVRVFLEYLLWGAALVYAYASLRAEARAAERLKAALLGRTRLQRRAAEARLLALQSRVEPRFLFETLARVRSLYPSDAARAGSLLADLVAFLRAALPQDTPQGSTLARELELSRAYLAVRLERPGPDVLVADADAKALRRAFPPHVLLPVIEALLDAMRPSSARIEVEARLHAGECVLKVAPSAPVAATPRLDEIRARLHGLHGSAGRLSIEGDAGGIARVVITLPDEASS